MSVGRRGQLAVLTASVFCLLAVLLGGGPPPEIEGALLLSMPGGYYRTPVEVAVVADREGSIYYTLDCTLPTDRSLRYHQPLTLFADGAVRGQAVVLRARLYVDGRPAGQGVTATYFFGSTLDGLTLPLVSIVTDPANLYDHYTGIYTGGAILEQWQRSHPNQEPDWTSPANYKQRGPAWQRDAHIEIFDAGGRRITAQNAGLRIAGQATANHPSKSLRLVGVEETGGLLQLPFWSDRLHDYDRFVLRNAGNDDAYCRIRDGLAHSLGAEVGLPGQAFQPVAVYLNGRFHDVLNARDEQTPFWLANRYGADADSAAILSGDERSPVLEAGLASDLADYHTLLNWVQGRDFTQDSTLQALSQWVDLDNFTRFYAFQILCGNIDWPHNNSLLWRADGTGEMTDRRWRMSLKDLDVAFGQMVYSWDDVLAHAIRRSAFLPYLLKNERWKQEFVATCEELLASVLHPEYVLEMAAELRFAAAAETLHTGVFYRDPQRRDREYAAMAAFLDKQPEFLALCFERNLGVALKLPQGPPPALKTKESYSFAPNSVLLNGLVLQTPARRQDGILGIVEAGQWIAVDEYAGRNGLRAVVHRPTDSVMFLPAAGDTPR